MAKNPKRQTPLTDGERDHICKLIEEGASRKTAARIVGCHPSTITNTANRNADFDKKLAKAEGECEMFHLRLIREAKSGWQAHAWFLERKYWDRYGRRDAPLPTTASAPNVKIRPMRGGNVRPKIPDANA